MSNTYNQCYTLNCGEHAAAVDVYTSSICEVVNTAVQQCSPAVDTHRKGIPGWNDYVKPYQEENLFWHGVWMAAGSPEQGKVAHIYRTAKMQYRYPLRRLKRESYNIQKDKFTHSYLMVV